MFTYEFRTCTTKEKEIYYFVERRAENQQMYSREVELPGSLLSFLYWDIEFMMREFQQLTDGTRRVIENGDPDAWDDTHALLQRLADYHIYFELLRLDWEHRFSQARSTGQASPENASFVTWLEELIRKIFTLGARRPEKKRQIVKPEKCHLMNLQAGLATHKIKPQGGIGGQIFFVYSGTIFELF